MSKPEHISTIMDRVLFNLGKKVESKMEWQCPECDQQGTYQDLRKPLDLGVDTCPMCGCEVEEIE